MMIIKELEILIHNRYAAEHITSVNLSHFHLILIHNRYAAEHSGCTSDKHGVICILIHNRYAAEHSNTSQFFHHILYIFTKFTPPILNSSLHPPSTNQHHLPILFTIPVRIPQQIPVHSVFAPAFYPYHPNSFQQYF